MSLSQLYHNLTPNELYPDLVQMLHWYSIPSLQPRTFVETMRSLHFRRNRKAGGWLGTIEIPVADQPEASPERVRVVANLGRNSISLKFPVNVLRVLHREEIRDFGDERSATGDNFLHPDGFDSAGPVWERLAVEASNIGLHIDQLAQDIAERMRPGSFALFQSARVNKIELCSDFEAGNPRAVFRRLFPYFTERFRRVGFQAYERRRTALWAGCLFHNCNLVRGHPSEGIGIKMYTKTNRRIRLEIEYAREALGHKLIKGIPLGIEM